MKQPLVSICIPTHNRPELLKLALNSALNQTYKNIEIIISDSSSNQKTNKYIKGIINRKIKYCKQNPKTDPFDNAVWTINNSNGNYIKILYDDDLLMPDCVEKMVNVLEKYPNVGIVMSPLKIIDVDNNQIQPTFYFFKKMKFLYKYLDKNTYIKKESIMNDFLTNKYPCCVPTGTMFRKSLFLQVGGYEKLFYYISDVDICMNFATRMDFYYIDEFLSKWRFSKSSDTVNILHRRGIRLDIFYLLTKKYLPYTKNIRKAYFFASKRTTLNIMAGIRSGNIKLVIETIKTILYNDPYIINLFILPFNLLFEIIRSVISI